MESRRKYGRSILRFGKSRAKACEVLFFVWRLEERKYGMRCLFSHVLCVSLLLITTVIYAEDITITTYYPSPNGIYDALLAKRFAVGDVNGDSSINISDIPSVDGYLLVADKLGIGTASPLAALNTAYGIAIGSGSGVSTTDGNRRSLQFLTDTSYGGTYNSHSGYLLYSTMPGGWGSAQLNFAVSTNWGVYNTANPTMTLSGTNVGIGITSPGAQLHLADIYPAGGRNLLIGDDVYLSDIDTANTLGIYGSSDSSIASIRLGSNGATISGYGNNIGIGTTTPNANMKLQVAGEICSSTLGGSGGHIRMISGSYGCFIRNDGSNTYFLFTNAGNQYGSWNSLRPLYINNASGYVTFGNGHGDLAENYYVSGGALRGSLMSIDTTVPSTAVKAGPSQRSLLGVVSTTPGAVMDTDGGFHIGWGTKKEYKDEKAPVVLAGAAPILVTSHNGRISIGDPLGISPVAGFGAKAVSAGLTAGMALEPFPPKDVVCKTAASIERIEWPEDNGKNSKRPCFRLPDGTYVGKIMAAVNVTWYDPGSAPAGAEKELIEEMRGAIAELNKALKTQQQEIMVLKQEMGKVGK